MMKSQKESLLSGKNRNTQSVLLWTATVFLASTAYADSPEPPGRVIGDFDVPVLEGPEWQVASNPDLGKYTTEKQQPVDFGVWQAADGTWQLWSCVRGTSFGGKNRLFFRWEGKSIDEPDWKPMGIAMESDESLGEMKGGLQAPHVVKHDGKYHMLYGDWNHVCQAVSDDGKKFSRVIQADGKTGAYSDGAQTRDPMAINIKGLWHVYTTAHPNKQCVIRCRTTSDFKHWSPYATTVAFGGRGGAGPFSAECPQVVERDGRFYLFRTEKYGQNPKTHVYVSTDPLQFGINRDEWHYVKTMAIAAPEYVKHDDKEYLAVLNRGLDGIYVQRLKWVPASDKTMAESNRQ